LAGGGAGDDAGGEYVGAEDVGGDDAELVVGADAGTPSEALDVAPAAAD
jgi:hypothetical protein